MGLWLFLLLYELALIWNSSEVAPRNFPFRCLQISSFFNSTWWHTDVLMWLGELQTHSWRNGSDTIHFLKPWSQGSFKHQQWEELRHILKVYKSSITRDVQEFAIRIHKDYPFELQGAAGCGAYPGNASETFLHVAFEGIHVASFQGTSWVSTPDAPNWLDRTIKEVNKDEGSREMVQSLLSDTCPQLTRGLIEAGKSDLEQQDGSHSSSSLWVGLVSLLVLLGVTMGLIIWMRRRSSN